MTRRCILGALVITWACAAQARIDGIATTGFPVPVQGCNFCHSGGLAPTVTLECVDCGAPPAVEPLSVHELTLTVLEIGLQDHAGLNVSSVEGTLSTGGGFATNTQTIAGAGGRLEITHTAPKPASGGATAFSFLWTAPNAATTATLQGWGNAVNNNGNTGGDAASVVTLDIAVGGGAPTPTDTPEPTSTPTATATVATGCPAMVDPGCTAGFGKALLLVKATVPGREKLVAKLSNGPALAQADMGNPLDLEQGGTGTAYSLCVYDDANALAGGLLVDRAGALCDGGPCWRALGHAPNDPRGPGKGYRYTDGSLSTAGVRKILYRGGDAGRSKAIVLGKGSGLPKGLAAALQLTAQATLQLRSSDGDCLSVELGDIRKQETDFFEAK